MQKQSKNWPGVQCPLKHKQLSGCSMEVWPIDKGDAVVPPVGFRNEKKNNKTKQKNKTKQNKKQNKKQKQKQKQNKQTKNVGLTIPIFKILDRQKTHKQTYERKKRQQTHT